MTRRFAIKTSQEHEDIDVVAERSVTLDLPLDEDGRLGAAARLDALGVEVLEAVERRGVSETTVRLVYSVRVVPASGGCGIAAPFADLAALRRLLPPYGIGENGRICEARCAAFRRSP